MSDNLKILISAGLDSVKTMRDINNDLRTLAKHPALQKLHIEIKMNDNYTRSAYSFLSIITRMNDAIAQGTVELGKQAKSVHVLKGKMEEVPAVETKTSMSKKVDSDSLAKKSLTDQAGKDIDSGLRSAVNNGDNIQLLSEAIGEAGLKFKSLSWFSNVYTSSAISARLATVGLQAAMSMGLSLAITGVTWALSAMVEAIAKSKKESAEAIKINYDQVKSLREQKQSLFELKTEMESLQQTDDRGDLNTEGKQRLLDIQSQLVEQYGVAANKIDAEGKAYSDSNTSINARTEALERQIKAEESLNRSKLIAQDSKNTKELKNAQEDVGDYKNRVQNTRNQIEKLEGDINSGVLSPDDFITQSKAISQYGNLSRSDKFWDQKLLTEHSYSAQKLLEAYNQELAELEVKLGESSTDMETALHDRQEVMSTSANNYIDSLVEKGTQISDSQRMFIQEIVNSISGNGSSVLEQEGQIEEIIKGMSSGDFEGLITSYHNLVDQFEQDPSSTDNTKISVIRQQVEDLINSVTNGVSVSSDFMPAILSQFPDVEQKAFSLKEAMEEIQSSYDTTSGKVSLYNELLNENSSGNGLSADRVAQLIKENQSLVDLFYIENGVIKLNTDLTTEQRDKELQGFRDIAKAKKDDLIASNQILSQKLLAYGIELKSIESVEDAIRAKETFNKTFVDVNGTGIEGRQFFEVNKANKKDGNAFLDTIIALMKGSSILDESLETVENAAETAGEQLSELQKQLMAVDEAINRSSSKRERYAKSSQKYRDSLQEENKLLEQKKKLIEQGEGSDSASPPSTKSESKENPPSTIPSSGVAAMLAEAGNLQGKLTQYEKIPGEYKGTYEQFVKGATSDCSQFVQEIFKEFLNIRLPRVSSDQAKSGISVDKKDLQPGDLVFFNDGDKGNKNVSHVGIYMGKNKFVQMGSTENGGLNEQNLTSNYWEDRYLKARRIVGGVSQKNNDGMSDEWIDADNQKYRNEIDIINSNITSSQNELDEQDGLMKKSQSRQSKFTDGSEEYRIEENKQIDIFLEKRKILHVQANMIRDLMKKYHIESDELDTTIRTLGETYDGLTHEIINKRVNLGNSGLEEFKDRLSDVGYQLELSKAKMSEYGEGSAEYTKELQNQVFLTKEQIVINKEAIAYLEQQLLNEQNSVKVKAELKDSMEQLILDNYEYSQSLKEINESYADSVISNYKKMLEKKRDLELEAMEKSKQSEDERHTEYMKSLDDELKRFEEVIDAQLKLMDRQNVSDDYDKDLNKMLQDRQDLLSQINTLALDDSYEAKAKMKSLNEQLSSKDEEISDFRLDRERELRKQNLSDQLEDKKEQIENQKELEDDHHTEIIKNWEKEKEAKEQLYKGMLEDEQVFYQLKQGLLSNDAAVVQSCIEKIKGEYGTFFLFLQEQMAIVGTDADLLGKKLLDNLFNDIKKDADKLDQNPNNNSVASDSHDNGGSQTGGETKDTPAARAAWGKYLENKFEAEKIRKDMVGLEKKDPKRYKDLEKNFEALRFQNEDYRKTYSFFPDKSYEELKNFNPFSAESGGMTPNFTKGKFLLAHEKELILNKTDTANLLTAVDITRGLISGIQNIASSFFNSSPAVVPAGGDVNMYITIDKLQGNEDGANTFFSMIQKNLKKSGI